MMKYWFSIISLFIIDRLSKVYMLQKPPLIDKVGFIDLHFNPNVAFSWPVVDFILYPLIIIILVLLVHYWLKDWKDKKISVWPLGLIIIGAVSNLLDRLSYGGVVDFISVPFFTVFNFSDIYIFIGVVWTFVKLTQGRRGLTKQ